MFNGKKRYISILRGMNVGGKRKFIMSDLKTLYESPGFSNAKTFIQNGNVIFDYSLNDKVKTLCKKIEYGMFKNYGFKVPVIIRSFEEMKKISHLLINLRTGKQ